MPYSTFNSGLDRQIVITDNTSNSPVLLGGNRIKLDMKPKQKALESEPCDNGGYVINRNIPGGWMGTIEIERANGDGDRLQALVDSTFYGSGAQRYYTIVETTSNSEDNSTDVFTYTQCTLTMEDAGTWERSGKVPVTFTVHATDRKES